MKRIEMQTEKDVQATAKKYSKQGIITNTAGLKRELQITSKRQRKASPVTMKFRKLKVGEGIITTKAKASYFRSIGYQLRRSISVTTLGPNQYLVERMS